MKTSSITMQTAIMPAPAEMPAIIPSEVSRVVTLMPTWFMDVGDTTRLGVALLASMLVPASAASTDEIWVELLVGLGMGPVVGLGLGVEVVVEVKLQRWLERWWC